MGISVVGIVRTRAASRRNARRTSVAGIALLFIVVALSGCAAPAEKQDDKKDTGTGTGGGTSTGGDTGGDTTPDTPASILGVAFVSAPVSGLANSQSIFCWSVDGTGTVPHVALHTDSTSRASTKSFGDYSGATYYPDNQSSPASGGYKLPGTFCSAVKLPESGTLYVRGHALINGPGVLTTDEKAIVANAGLGAVTFVGKLPSVANPGAKINYCWAVEGAGRVAHVALHADNASHAASTDFGDYAGATYYPDNKSSPDPAGYSLPGTFCTAVDAPASGTFYVRAHALLESPGVLSADEAELEVIQATPKTGQVTAVRFEGTVPADAPTNASVLLCWSVDGAGNVETAALVGDTVTHASGSAAATQHYPLAFFPENRTTANPDGYNLPGTFCTNVGMPASGSLFIIAAAMDSRGTAEADRTTSEREIKVGPYATGVSFSGTLPAAAAAGSDLLVCWKVEGAGTINHVAVHTDAVSHGENASGAAFLLYAGAAYYPDNQTALTSYTLPGTFCTNVKIPSTGRVFIRAHAMDKRGTDLGSFVSPDERAISAT